LKIRLYLEEDSMSHALVRGLRARGVVVITALEEGMIERGDQEHLEYAAKLQRVLYSFKSQTSTISTADTSRKTENTQGSSSRANNNSLSASNCAGF
jgi:hypothetical protein